MRPRASTGRILLALLLAPALAGAVNLRPGRLRSDGTWFRDGRGRVVLLRGMNYSGLEFGNFPGALHGPEEGDFAQMASWGVNVIRLPIAWHYLEPAPNVFDRIHLRDVIDWVVRRARRYDIGVVLEFHQFGWSPCTGGNGVPAWTCSGKGYSMDTNGALRAEHDFWNGALAPDGRPLVDHLLDTWYRVARHYRSRNVIGFDFLNEPLDNKNALGFEHDTLYPFYRRAIATIRRVGAHQPVFLEPPLLRNVGARAHPEPVGDTNLVYAPHLYTTTFGLPDLQYDGDRAAVTADYDQAEAEAAELGAVLWVGEYGGSTVAAGGFLDATELFLADSLAEQETRLLGSGFWAYFPSDNTFSLVDAAGEEKGDLVDIFIRPYPMMTAGIPQAIGWNPDLRTFDFTFIEDPDEDVRDPTLVFLPAERRYPDGFVVETSPGLTAEFEARQNVLVVRRRDRSEGLHEVHIHPAP
jgi:endoglycosylceramidase